MKREKKIILLLALLSCMSTGIFAGYWLNEKKNSDDYARLVQLKEETDGLFSDNEKTDISEKAASDYLAAIEQQIEEEKERGLGEENRALLTAIADSYTEAVRLKKLETELSKLSSEGIARDEVTIAELQAASGKLGPFKERYSRFYEREEGFLQEMNTQVQQREEAVRFVSDFFEEDEVRTNIKKDEEKTAYELISQVASEQVRNRLTASMERVRESMEQNRKLIALTFDDGPGGASTERILDALAAYEAKATFFMLSKNAANFPALAERISREGHEVANHSISHPDLTTLSGEQIRSQMIDSLYQIEAASGARPSLFRPPYGAFNQTVQAIGEESGQAIVMWSIDTMDWSHRDPYVTLGKIKQSAQNGSIVLMHDIHPATADAVPMILEYLSNEGYEFVTVSELYAASGT